MYVLAIERAGLARWSPSLPTRKRISTREFIVFNQELATLLKAGMPLVQSLDILRQRVPNAHLKAVLDDVYERVRSGDSLSESFEAQGDLFPGVYTASLLAGEKSGGLEEVIRRYVSYVKVVSAVKRKTVSALVYPAILTILAMIVVSIIVLRVVPEFAGFYASFDAELPVATRVIVAVSQFLTANLWTILVLSVAAVGVGWWWVSQPERRAGIDGVILRLPFVGPTARKFATSQMARTLATLLGGGIPLVNGLDISARSLGNRRMAQELEHVADRVREGEALAATMQATGVIPDVAIKMVEVGESTGALQEMLNSLADFFDEEIETNLSRFVTLIEPALLVVMGIVIAGLLLALYLPLFQLSSVMG
jgi:type IV pilus assembly protein PilC